MRVMIVQQSSNVTNDVETKRQLDQLELKESKLVDQFDSLRKDYLLEQEQLRSRYKDDFMDILSEIDSIHKQQENIQS